MKRAILLIALMLMLARVGAFAQIAAVPNLMNFHGRLTAPDGTPVADGNYSIRFSLWSAVSAGTEKWNQTIDPVAVRNGAFGVLLSGFPAGTFSNNLWLEIKVGTDAPLSPRQQLASVAYAFKADKVKDGAITTASLAANAVTSAKIANGTITTADLAPNTLNNLSWLLGGNTGTDPATQFLGTTDNQPLHLRVYNQRALRLEYATSTVGVVNYSGLNTLGGFRSHSVTPGVVGATLWGGWSEQSGDFLVDYPNRVTDIGGTVSGGRRNRAGNNAGHVSDASHATVGGGELNIASNAYTTVAGGRSNTASGQYASVGGGISNSASDHSTTIGGGSQNRATLSGATVGGGIENTANYLYATVAGGIGNTAGDRGAIGGGGYNTATGSHATVPGGYINTASGTTSFAAGARAQAQHAGAFVWSDWNDPYFASTAVNQFSARATGGVRIVTGINTTTGAPTAGVTLTAGDSSWNSLSDRNAKTDFQAVDPEDVLERLLGVPISTWNYKTNNAIRHIGPMAQDFYAAFGLGTDDKHISAVDADGVALAAIQGLYRKLHGQQQQIDELQAVKSENAALKRQLMALSAIVREVKAVQNQLRANHTNNK
jgi:trimeric autotransporter adhesin